MERKTDERTKGYTPLVIVASELRDRLAEGCLLEVCSSRNLLARARGGEQKKRQDNREDGQSAEEWREENVLLNQPTVNEKNNTFYPGNRDIHGQNDERAV